MAVLHEKFNDPTKAVCYLSVGIGEDFPNGAVEISLRAGAKMRLERCRVRDIGRALERLCKKFPRASVYYDPERTDGVVGEVHCHCEENIKRTCCRHGKSRPIISVKLVDAGQGAAYPGAGCPVGAAVP